MTRVASRRVALSALLAGLAAELTPGQMARFAQHLRARGLA